MSVKPTWQSADPSSGTQAGTAGPEEAASMRRTILLISIVAVVSDLAVAGWILLGPIELATDMRWLIAGLVLVSGAAALFMLRRIWRQRFGA